MSWKRSNVLVVKKIVDAIFSSTSREKHFPILREMFDFLTITNFKQTIEELIEIDQMHIFGISPEMQSILRHLKTLDMLGKIPAIRTALHSKYEELHNRTVVIVKVAEDNKASLNDIIAAICSKVEEPCDFLYIPSNVAGVIVQFKDKVFQYTPSQISKKMKIV